RQIERELLPEAEVRSEPRGSRVEGLVVVPALHVKGSPIRRQSPGSVVEILRHDVDERRRGELPLGLRGPGGARRLRHLLSRQGRGDQKEKRRRGPASHPPSAIATVASPAPIAAIEIPTSAGRRPL